MHWDKAASSIDESFCSVFFCCFEQGFIGFYKGITASYFGITETVINFVLYECIKSNLARLRQRTDDTNPSKSPGNEPIDFVIAGAISKTVACCLAYPHGSNYILLSPFWSDCCQWLWLPIKFRSFGKADSRCVPIMRSNINSSRVSRVRAGTCRQIMLKNSACINSSFHDWFNSLSNIEVARTRLREENTRFHGFFQTLHTVYREEGYRGLYRGLGTQLVRQIPNMAIMMTTYEATVYLLDK